MDEQIKKIISDICPFHKEYGSCVECDAEMDIGDEPCYWACVAKVINQNDYRKQSDVIDEFAERLKNYDITKLEKSVQISEIIDEVATKMKGGAE